MADTTNDGGMAFPRGATEFGGCVYQPQDGMSLRDYYIGQALASPHDMTSLMRMANGSNRRPTEVLASVCCDWAEAVMAERERRYGHKPEADGASVE
jgi:hypothetical protein